MSNIFQKLQSELTPLSKNNTHNSDHGRYQINNLEGKRILIKNIPFLFTCDEN